MWNVDELKVYEQAMLIGEEVWKIVIKWDFFNKDTLGKQWIRAADSVALNISEGNGRFFYSDRKVFFYYSRGSAYETKSALAKAKERGLIDAKEFDSLDSKLNHFFILINCYIKAISTLKSNK